MLPRRKPPRARGPVMSATLRITWRTSRARATSDFCLLPFAALEQHHADEGQQRLDRADCEIYAARAVAGAMRQPPRERDLEHPVADQVHLRWRPCVARAVECLLHDHPP